MLQTCLELVSVLSGLRNPNCISTMKKGLNDEILDLEGGVL